jgi:hypothetical protein
MTPMSLRDQRLLLVEAISSVLFGDCFVAPLLAMTNSLSLRASGLLAKQSPSYLEGIVSFERALAIHRREVHSSQGQNNLGKSSHPDFPEH